MGIFSKHYNIATMGVRAGHKLMAMMGFGFSVEIIVQPRDSGGGGGLLIPDLREYQVTIRITRNGKVWEQSYITGMSGLSTLEYVVIVFKGIKNIFDGVMFSIKSPIISIKTILVKLYKR